MSWGNQAVFQISYLGARMSCIKGVSLGLCDLTKNVISRYSDVSMIHDISVEVASRTGKNLTFLNVHVYMKEKSIKQLF